MSEAIVWHPCGCFSHPAIPGEIWRCSMHRGQSEDQRQADAEQQAIEAAAMNDWIEP